MPLLLHLSSSPVLQVQKTQQFNQQIKGCCASFAEGMSLCLRELLILRILRSTLECEIRLSRVVEQVLPAWVINLMLIPLASNILIVCCWFRISFYEWLLKHSELSYYLWKQHPILGILIQVLAPPIWIWLLAHAYCNAERWWLKSLDSYQGWIPGSWFCLVQPQPLWAFKKWSRKQNTSFPLVYTCSHAYSCL